MNRRHSPQSDQLDELLTVLADRHCRDTLSHLRDSPTDVASVRDLATDISEEDHGGTERVALRLQHSVLPRLADIDAVEYDARSRTVRYRGHSELEPLLDGIRERYPAER